MIRQTPLFWSPTRFHIVNQQRISITTVARKRLKPSTLGNIIRKGDPPLCNKTSRVKQMTLRRCLLILPTNNQGSRWIRRTTPWSRRGTWRGRTPTPSSRMTALLSDKGRWTAPRTSTPMTSRSRNLSMSWAMWTSMLKPRRKPSRLSMPSQECSRVWERIKFSQVRRPERKRITAINSNSNLIIC